MTQTFDQICDQFEEAWRQGQPISIEEAIERADPADQASLLHELIRLELGLRQAAGQPVTPQDYLDRFPGKTSIVESACLVSRHVEDTVDLPASQSEVTTDFSHDQVAIKLTHETLPPHAQQMLQEEAHILCDLDHPHISRVRDFDAGPSWCWISSAAGRSVRWLKRKR